MIPLYHRPGRGPTRVVAAAGLAAGLLFAPALSPAAIRLELGAAFSRSTPGLKSVYAHTHPAALPYGTSSGSGGQFLTFGAGGSSGFSFDGSLFFNDHFALQILTGGYNADLAGTSTPYHVRLDYVALQPPQYEAKTYVYERSSEWPVVTGFAVSRVTSLNALVRLGRGPILFLDLSAGLSLFRIEAEIDGLGYTKFTMGGHSVLFPEAQTLKIVTEPASRLGGNAGAEVAAFIASNAALTLEARWFFAADARPSFRFEVVDTESLISPIDPDTTALPKGELALDPSFFRWSVGFKFRF